LRWRKWLPSPGSSPTILRIKSRPKQYKLSQESEVTTCGRQRRAEFSYVCSVPWKTCDYDQLPSRSRAAQWCNASTRCIAESQQSEECHHQRPQYIFECRHFRFTTLQSVQEKVDCEGNSRWLGRHRSEGTSKYEDHIKSCNIPRLQRGIGPVIAIASPIHSSRIDDTLEC
jgi:hypothetical protein